MEDSRVIITPYGNGYNGEKPNTFSYVGPYLSESSKKDTLSFQTLPLEANHMLIGFLWGDINE